MKASKDIYYGLDIQKEYIAVAQYSRSEHAVTLVALQPVDGSGSEVLSESLKVLKSKFKFINTKINCSIPVEHAVVKTVPVDRTESDIESALYWELEQNIIGSADDYVYDFQQMNTANDHTSSYQLVAYRKKRVHELSALLKKNKLTAQCVDIDIFALANIFEASYPEQASQPALLIHGESADARVILTLGSSVIDYECIRYDPEPDPQAFAAQVAGVLPRLGKTGGMPINTSSTPCFTAGMLFTNGQYLDNVKQTLPGTTLLHPFTKVECRIGIDEDKLATYLPQLTLAVGLAIRGDE